MVLVPRRKREATRKVKEQCNICDRSWLLAPSICWPYFAGGNSQTHAHL